MRLARDLSLTLAGLLGAALAAAAPRDARA